MRTGLEEDDTYATFIFICCNSVIFQWSDLINVSKLCDMSNWSEKSFQIILFTSIFIKFKLKQPH